MRFLVVPLVLVSFLANAQGIDSLVSVGDTTVFAAFEDDPDNTAAADSLKVVVRSFDNQKLEELRADPELQYGVEATVGESLWQRFLGWIAKLIEYLFDSLTGDNWGSFLGYALSLLCFIAIIMLMLKVNVHRVLYGDTASPVPHHTLHENIHAMDFEQLIQEAVTTQDYRLAVRLLFLYALKLLSDKNHIHWRQGKTNQDYLSELAVEKLKPGFSELNYFFEYAWYGNFTVTNGVYARVKQIFDAWQRSL